MNEFSIINETNVEVPYIDEIKKLLDYALNYENVENAIFNVIVVDNDIIRKINKEYRNKDSVTDVISFALEDTKDIDLPIGRLLGDIYISIDKVKSQALEYGHSELREFAFLTIHGLLHLLGYDHMNSDDEKVMFELQEGILNGYGIKREK